MIQNPCQSYQCRMFSCSSGLIMVLIMLGMFTWLTINQNKIVDQKHETEEKCQKLYNSTHTYWSYFACISCTHCPTICDRHACVRGGTCLNQTLCPEVCKMWKQYQIDTQEYNDLDCSGAKARSDSAEETYVVCVVISVILYTVIGIGLLCYCAYLYDERRNVPDYDSDSYDTLVSE